MGFFGPKSVWETTLVTLDGAAAIRERVEEWFGAFDELEFEVEQILDLGNGVTLTVVNQRARPAGGSTAQVEKAGVTGARTVRAGAARGR